MAIPNSIVLSAQSDANMEYSSKRRSITFKFIPKAFLILDGQHRVYGFKFANEVEKLRVPVVIFNNLSKAEEARLFIDINTKQRPVPNELLLDIKKLAQTEVSGEKFCREIFDLLNDEPDSCMRGLMSSAAKARGKVTRPQFNKAIKPSISKIGSNDTFSVYSALNTFIEAFKLKFDEISGNRKLITNITYFTSVLYIFPTISRKMKDKYPGNYSLENYVNVLQPVLSNVDMTLLKKNTGSPKRLSEIFEKFMEDESILF